MSGKEDATLPTTRDDFASHDHVMSITVQQVVRELVDALGLTLVAEVAGVGETRAVTAWMDKRAPQKPQTLRFALQLTRMLCEGDDTWRARAWFQGSNPHLDDRSPVMLLRSLPLDEIQVPLIAAARAFSDRKTPQ